jgi:GcrA cell cycle regulator
MRPSPSTSPWYGEEGAIRLQRLIALVEQRVRIKDIAKQLGLTRNQAWAKYTHLGLTGAYADLPRVGGCLPDTTWHGVEGEKRIALLKKRYVEGAFLSAIAKELDISRNAVVGKIYRLGLSAKGRYGKSRAAEAKSRWSKTPQGRRALSKSVGNRLALRICDMPKPQGVPSMKKAPQRVASGAPEPTAKMLSLLDLGRHHCRWPYGDNPFYFCGHRKETGSSYCEYHRDLSVGAIVPSEMKAAA